MINEPFAIGSSIIHRLDPRIRVGYTIVYAFVVALSYRFSVLAAALMLSVILVLISQVSLKEVSKRLIAVNALIFLLWVIMPFTFGGELLARMGSLSIYRPGVTLAAQITLKSNAILLAFIALMATMPFATLGYALHRLRAPQKIVQLLLMTYRYIFVIENEYQRLIRAAKIRGFRPGTNINTYRTFAYIIGMLFVRSAARADRVHQAMLCRGFRGRFYSLQEFQIGKAGWLFSIIMTVLIIALIVMEI